MNNLLVRSQNELVEVANFRLVWRADRRGHACAAQFRGAGVTTG